MDDARIAVKQNTLGIDRYEAMELIELACQRHPDVATAEALVPLVYRLKQGIEV